MAESGKVIIGKRSSVELRFLIKSFCGCPVNRGGHTGVFFEDLGKIVGVIEPAQLGDVLDLCIGVGKQVFCLGKPQGIDVFDGRSVVDLGKDPPEMDGAHGKCRAQRFYGEFGVAVILLHHPNGRFDAFLFGFGNIAQRVLPGDFRVDLIKQRFAVNFVGIITGSPKLFELDKHIFKAFGVFMGKYGIGQLLIRLEEKVDAVVIVIGNGYADLIFAVFCQKEDVPLAGNIRLAVKIVGSAAGKDIDKTIAVPALTRGFRYGDVSFFNIGYFIYVEFLLKNLHNITVFMISQVGNVCNIYVRKVIFV